MTERIGIDVDDAELEAVITRIDDAILKKVELLSFGIPKEQKRITEVPRETREITEALALAEDEVRTIIDRLELELDDIQAKARFTEDLNEAMVDKTTAEIIRAQESARNIAQLTLQESLLTEEAIKATMTEAQLTIRKIMAELSGVQTYTEAVKAMIMADLAYIKVEGDAAIVNMGRLQAFTQDLPQVDRATRMILLRIPGLRQVLQLLYVIKMEERTLRLGGIRGPITAAITTVIYAAMALKSLEQRQNQLEARMRDLERITMKRYITMDEALKGYDRRPEKYRATVAP